MKSEIFLRHIIDEIEYIQQKSNELKYEDFIINEDIKRIFVRSLEVIGEAVKNLNTKFIKKYSQVEWKKIAGLRDILIHHYFGIDYDRVWDIVKNKIPELKEKIEIIIKDIRENEKNYNVGNGQK